VCRKTDPITRRGGGSGRGEWVAGGPAPVIVRDRAVREGAQGGGGPRGEVQEQELQALAGDEGWAHCLSARVGGWIPRWECVCVLGGRVGGTVCVCVCARATPFLPFGQTGTDRTECHSNCCMVPLAQESPRRGPSSDCAGSPTSCGADGVRRWPSLGCVRWSEYVW
jgi:hypothetical protein